MRLIHVTRYCSLRNTYIEKNEKEKKNSTKLKMCSRKCQLVKLDALLSHSYKNTIL